MGGHVGMGVGGMPLVGLVGWGFMLGCSDTVGSLQLESHHSWLARGVPSSPFCAHVFYPCSFEAFNISLSCDQKLMVSPFFSLPFPHWHMMTPLLLQLFRRPSWINAQESREEIWIKWKNWTHPCQTFWHIGATVTSLLANLLTVPQVFISALVHGLLFVPFLKLSVIDVITHSPLDKIHVYYYR